MHEEREKSTAARSLRGDVQYMLEQIEAGLIGPLDVVDHKRDGRTLRRAFDEIGNTEVQA